MSHEDDKQFLVDTNIVSYFISDGDWKLPYMPLLQGKTLYISFMTLSELLEGAYRKGLNERNIAKLKDRLHDEYTVVPWDENVCDLFGKIRAARRDKPISVPDALIAATALAYDLPLVTHNKKDFDDIGGLNVESKYEKTTEPGV